MSVEIPLCPYCHKPMIERGHWQKSVRTDGKNRTLKFHEFHCCNKSQHVQEDITDARKRA
jgi:hypothetical protein